MSLLWIIRTTLIIILFAYIFIYAYFLKNRKDIKNEDEQI